MSLHAEFHETHARHQLALPQSLKPQQYSFKWRFVPDELRSVGGAGAGSPAGAGTGFGGGAAAAPAAGVVRVPAHGCCG